MDNMVTFRRKSKTKTRYHNTALSKLDHVLDFMTRTEQLIYVTNTTPTENRVMRLAWISKNEMGYRVHSKNTQRVIVDGLLKI